jgi:addiction module HigA family antidote
MEPFMPALTVGEFLTQEFLIPLHLSAYRLAKDIRVPVSRIQEILSGKRALSLDTSLRLAYYFGTSEDYFINLQQRVSLEAEKQRIRAELATLPTYQQRQGSAER